MNAQDQLRQALAKHLQTTTYAKLSAKTGLSTSVLYHFLHNGRSPRFDNAILIAQAIGYRLQLHHDNH